MLVWKVLQKVQKEVGVRYTKLNTLFTVVGYGEMLELGFNPR